MLVAILFSAPPPDGVSEHALQEPGTVQDIVDRVQRGYEEKIRLSEMRKDSDNFSGFLTCSMNRLSGAE
ncbi:MAG: hypothetical protein JWL80_201 [Parcubacteria group bacterium]|nr:hypothetical protein [Parcubacteria group bacterium]